MEITGRQLFGMIGGGVCGAALGAVGAFTIAGGSYIAELVLKGKEKGASQDTVSSQEIVSSAYHIFGEVLKVSMVALSAIGAYYGGKEGLRYFSEIR